MEQSHFDGVGELGGGTYGRLKVGGVHSCKGDLEAEEFIVDGIFESKGSLKAGLFDCDGVVEFAGSIKGDRLLVDGILNVKNGGKVEANEILCNGIINTKSEISADTIEADGYINAAEIVGDHVSIKSRTGFLVGLFSKKSSAVDFIEATTVELRGVKAKTVSGKDVVIGPKCIIEKVDCSGTLFVDPTATIQSVSGDFVRTN